MLTTFLTPGMPRGVRLLSALLANDINNPAEEINAQVTKNMDVSDLLVSFVDSEGNDVVLTAKLKKANLEVHVMGPDNQLLAKHKKWSVGTKQVLTKFQMGLVYRQLEEQGHPDEAAFQVLRTLLFDWVVVMVSFCGVFMF